MKNIECTLKQHIPQQIIKVAEKFESILLNGPHHQSSLMYFKIMVKNHKQLKKQIKEQPKIGLSELGSYQLIHNKQGTFINQSQPSMIHSIQIVKPELNKQFYIDELTTVVSEELLSVQDYEILQFVQEINL